MLAEQRATCLPLGARRRVQGRWDQHLDDRLLGPAVHRRIEPGAVHVIEARRHDDAGGQMIALLRQHRELGQLRQRHVHSEGRAFALPAVHAARDVGVDSAVRHESIEQQLRIDASNNRFRPISLAACNNADGAAARYDEFLNRRVRG